jgi:hypothetical protein
MSNIAQKCIESKINNHPPAHCDSEDSVQGSGMTMVQANLNVDFWVEVRHRHHRPKRYTWEIHRKGVCLSVEESRGRFGSWEEASRVGNDMLKQFSQAH